MDRNPSLLLKDPCQMKRRNMNGASNLIERDALANSRREIRLRRFSSLRVIRTRDVATSVHATMAGVGVRCYSRRGRHSKSEARLPGVRSRTAQAGMAAAVSGSG